MGNPIQYHNTDNKGSFVKRLQYAPLGRTQRGVNENVSPESEFTNKQVLVISLLTSS